MNLEELILPVVTRNARQDFPIDKLCASFSAQAATFWLSGEIDSDEMILVASENRPDLEEKLHNSAFSFSKSFVSHRLNNTNMPYFHESMDILRRYHWDNEEILRYSINNFSRVLFIGLQSKNGNYVGLVHFYYSSNAPSLNNQTVENFSKICGAIIETIDAESRHVMEERRKIGHEVGRFLTQAETLVMRARSSKKSGKNPEVYFDNLCKILQAARAAADTVTFREGVIKRKSNARFISIRRSFTDMSSISELGAKKIRASINGNTNMAFDFLVRMNVYDLDLILSNVISNAVKYSLFGGAIRASIKESKNYYRLIVSNNSMKISEPDLDRIWRFGYRGSNAGNENGDGVGLTIIKDICNVYGVRHELYQRVEEKAIWTDLRLDFPKEMCRWREFAD